MVLEVSRKAKRTVLALSAAGLAAGFLNGLLGAGGGIVLVYALSLLRPDRSPDGVRDTFAATVACVLPMTAVSALLYAESGRLGGISLTGMILPAAAGGVCGALLLDKISTGILKKIFAALVLFAGIRMIAG